MDLAIIPLLVGSVGLFLILHLFWTIKKESAGTPRMKEIAGYIQEGAHTFLKREFKTISYFIIVLAILLFIILGWQIAVGFARALEPRTFWYTTNTYSHGRWKN